MTVAITCNLSDGVILGVDSAVTLNNQKGQVVKVYENAEKLFQLKDKPVGIAFFGIGSMGTRSIGSYIREFEIANPKKVVSQNTSIPNIVEEVRKFFFAKYMQEVAPKISAAKKKEFDKIPQKELPILGIVVGGFSPNSFLSEVWQILIPINNTPNSATPSIKQGQFGTSWFAMYQPIQRYVKGIDSALYNELLTEFRKIKGSNLSKSEKEQLKKIVDKYEYKIPFVAMPIKEGITHVKFLLDLVINHYRFAVGAPIVGGKPMIGLVTYKGEKFKIIE